MTRVSLCQLVLLLTCASACTEATRPPESAGSGGTTPTTGSGGAAPSDCPDGAFVSLTYDDALGSQLDNAVPALEKHGFRATFFLTDVGTSQAWAALRAQGHELASHTLKHPCPAAAWVVPGNASQDYDLERLATELDDSLAQVKALGQSEPVSFAYPCGVTTVGDEATSYVPLVKTRFAGARGVVGSVITTLSDRYNVPAYFLKTDGAGLTSVVDQAVAKRGWIVFGFHGVGGDFEEVTLEAHDALLSYLEAESIPVLTFAEGLACKNP